MNKIIKYICLALFLTCSIQVSAQSTYYGKSQREQEQLRNKYGQALERAAIEVGQYVMKLIAPQSGKELSTEALIYEGITTSQEDGYIQCSIRISFTARDWPSVGWDKAETIGRMYLYPAYRSVDKHKVTFVPDEYNDHFVNINTKGRAKKQLEEGILLEY